jgi:hypothetical protein
MVTFLQGLTDSVRSAYCSQIRDTPQWFANLRRVVIPGGITDAADRFNRVVCNTDPDDVPELPPPDFTGGQCDCARYTVRVTFAFPAGGGTSEDYRGRGPFSSIRLVPDGSSQILRGVGKAVWRGPGDPAGYNACGPLADRQMGGNSYGAGVTITNIQIVAAPDGDACGNPDIVLPPPGPITINVDIDYTDNNDESVSINVPVLFAPVYIGIDGTLNIPIEIPAINFTGNINLNPEFNITPTFPEGTGSGSPDDDDLAPSDDEGLDSEIDPDKPDATIIGVVVRSQRSGPVPQTILFQSNGPDITAPRCANVRFLCRFGSVAAWTSDQPVKGVNEFIPCPSPFGAIDVVVNSENNWTSQFTPIRSRPPATFEP